MFETGNTTICGKNMATSVVQNKKIGKAAESEIQKKKIRVLHVINGEHYAGAERVQDLLAARLPNEGFDVAIACLKPCQFPRMMQTEGVTLYNLSMANRFDLRPAWRLIRIVRRGGYQIIHAHLPRNLLLAVIVSFFTGVPLVYHNHSPTTRDSTNRRRDWVNALVERVAMAWCSAVIPVSQSLGRYVRGRGVRDSKISVVPNGVAIRESRPERESARSDWVIGTMALFRPRKGTEVLLRAVAELKARGLSVSLRAVGRFETPEYERQIKRLVEELDIADLVRWTGFTRDIDAELHKMDVFVLPSLFGEGLPMVVLEAMAAGVPVVASNVEGIPETIRHGQDGLIVRPNDDEDLANTLVRLIEGKEFDWNELRQNARKRHAEKFSDQAMAAGVAQVYRCVLDDVV